MVKHAQGKSEMRAVISASPNPYQIPQSDLVTVLHCNDYYLQNALLFESLCINS